MCSTIGFNLPFMPPANLIKSCCIKREKHAVVCGSQNALDFFSSMQSVNGFCALGK